MSGPRTGPEQTAYMDGQQNGYQLGYERGGIDAESRLAAVERERDEARAELAALTEQYMTYVEGADL